MLSSLVHVRTFGFFRSIEYESLHVDLVDSSRSRWKWTFSSSTSADRPVEFLIPRDPTSIIPPMFFQNVTSLSSSPHRQLFNLHYVDLSDMSDVSVHFEVHPLSINLAYLLIYRFDRSPVLNTSLQQIDGWTLFCPASKNTHLHCL